MERIRELICGRNYLNLDELVNDLKDAGYEVEDVTTQWVSIWCEDRLVVLMLGGSINWFHVNSIQW